MSRARPLLLIALALAVAPAHAESDFWAEVRRPGITVYRRSMAEGRVLREQGRLREALVAFDRAAAALPDEPEGHLWRGNVLFDLDDARGAIDAWDSARELDPTIAEGVRHAFDMAIALSKAQEIARTVAEYERIIPRLSAGDDPELRAGIFANCGEAQMAQGRDQLDAAVRNYRRALEEMPTYRLGHWGLAVALDRQGSLAEAREELRRAIDGDPGLTALHRGGVFFIPPFELHAYLALGHDAQGRPTLAAEEWRLFLSEGGAAGPWREVAERHLTELGGARAVNPASPALAPRARLRPPAPHRRPAP